MTGQCPDAQQVVMLQFLKGLLYRRRIERATRFRPNLPSRSFSCERLEHRNLLSASGFGSLSEDTGNINGYLWNDLNGDGTRSSSDPGIVGWTVFLDSNRNGLRDEGEPTAITDNSGNYAFYAVPEGDHVVSAELPDGWELSTSHDPVRGVVQSAAAGSIERSVTSSPTLNTIARDHAAQQLIVRFTDAAQNDPEIIEALRNKQKSLGHETIESTKSGLELWDVGVDLMAAYRAWEHDPHLALIELNYNFTIAETVPNDERYSQMWALDNTGQTGGTEDADIDAPEAWDLQTGSSEVVIGVIDSGIDYTHPDLANNIWTNPGEIAGNGIDDDGNGYVDDIYGWDFVGGDSDPMDGNGHGTHVAGTIAAAGNNSVGITGVNWNAKLMPLRFLNDAGSGSIYHAVAALEYATMMGADITNNSWIGDPYTSSLQFAIDQANASGSLYVVCAGNNHNDNDVNPEYPASYSGDNVISVAATTKTDGLASYSNYGASTVHLGAPGSNILSTKPGGGYTTKSGTSMASPHVAGVASLLLSKRADLTPAAIRQAILQGTDIIPSLEGKTISDGRLNAYGALMEVAPSNGQFVSVTSDIATDATFGIKATNSTPHQFVQILDNGDEGFTHQGFTYQNNSLVSAAYQGDNHSIRGGSGIANWTFSDLADGEYQVFATWFHKYDNRYNALDTPYTISGDTGQQLAQSIVNQNDPPSEHIYNDAAWDKLATVDVTDGTLVVSLGPGSNPNHYAVADAIMIEGVVTPSLTLSPTSLTTSEDSDGIQITINRPNSTGELTVTCASSDESEATVPNTVIIPDGSTTATFTVTPTDDNEADGTQSVTITAGAAGYASTSVILQVTDDESSWVEILDNTDEDFSHQGFTFQNNSLVSSAYQGDNHTIRGGSGSATWTFSELPNGEYQVAATWFHKYNNVYNATDAPFTIVDGSGQTLASLSVDQTIIPSGLYANDHTWQPLTTVNVSDGVLSIHLGVGANDNRYSVADAIRIEKTSDSIPSLSLSIDALEFSESAGASAAAATVTRPDNSGDLIVFLASDDTSEATVPYSITIPDGETSSSFYLAAQDDDEVDGTKSVSITASASGHTRALETVSVTDDENSFVAILDNGDQGFVQDGYTYYNNPSVSDAYQGDTHTARGGTGTATWTFSNLEDGEYRVAATWFRKYNNAYNATDARFTIQGGSGQVLDSLAVDQSKTPDDFSDNDTSWETLSTVTVTDGVLAITLGPGSSSNRYSVADAIRIEKIAAPASPSSTADRVFGDYDL